MVLLTLLKKVVYHPFCKFRPIDFLGFDDSCPEEIIKNFKEYGISEGQKKLLLSFCVILEKFAEEKLSSKPYVNADEVLSDPKWNEIQKRAREVVEAFEDHPFLENKASEKGEGETN